jgi:sugar phosphate isomerase/epimerase
MLAFSTCWNNSRHDDGESMIDEILDLGFRRIELSHGMTVVKVPGLRKAFREGKFECVGVHNYFPSPVEVMIDAPDAYEFTSHREHERRRAMDMSLRTLDLAAEFKAGYVVLHMGSVPMSPAKWTRPLTRRVAAGEARDPSFTREKIAFVREREKIGPMYYERACEALETLATRANELGLRLAVESRSRFEDMPTEREMIALQQRFADNPAVGYWHDFGHVQLKHNLGLLDHQQWLARIAPHLIGGHLHDVEWPGLDHRVPFTGEIEYAPLLAHFPRGAPIVWELSPSRQTEQIRWALDLWRERFPEWAD